MWADRRQGEVADEAPLRLGGGPCCNHGWEGFRGGPVQDALQPGLSLQPTPPHCSKARGERMSPDGP